MVQKQPKWSDGVRLEEHSRRKHKILREYVFDYLLVRCKLPQRERFRLAIVDGFAGGGKYQCGISGSPLIFIEEVKRAVETINAGRVSQGLNAIEVECLLIFNDEDLDAIELLKTHVTPMLVQISQDCPKLYLCVKYLNEIFEKVYPEIKAILKSRRYRNVLFNLDQYGDSHVNRDTIVDMMHSYPTAEIFYTFMIKSLLAFLRKDQPKQLASRPGYLGLKSADIESMDGIMSKHDWLGTMENIVFDAFGRCAPYVSPFSINNPGGWRYWFIHFANIYRARQVYNNILHDNASSQAHFGRSGLNMLSYDPEHEKGSLYLFDDSGRVTARSQLLTDIPRLITESGDVVRVMDFYENIYNTTPAHADDVCAAIMESPDLEVITPIGRERRSAKTIKVDDVIKVKNQRSFFPMFLVGGSTGRSDDK